MPSGTDSRLDGLIRAMQGIRPPVTRNEYQLHELVAAALTEGGFQIVHEGRLGPRCRIDFIVDRVGIEVKRGKVDVSALKKQCARYLAFDALDALIVVADTRASLPDSILGKPVRVVGLNRLWGIALP